MATPKRSKMIDGHIKALAALKGATVEAGWFATERYSKAPGVPDKQVGMPIAKVARINEFGATIDKGTHVIVIPARPFMRGAWQAFLTNRKSIQSALADKLVKGKIKPDQALGQIGDAMVALIVRSIKNGGWQKNADSTIARKGWDKPLIHTSQMWQKVTSKHTP